MIEKIALTGAPGSGKSSIIRTLEYEWKEKVINEAAEDIIKYFKAKGIQEPWRLTDFQDTILELQLQREAEREHEPGRVFIDRGFLDGLAYYQIQGKTPSEAMKKAIEDTRGRYQKVYLIELGDNCEKTNIRKENLDEALKLQELQYQNYSNAGYDVERIPYTEIGQRTEKILKCLAQLKGGDRR